MNHRPDKKQNTQSEENIHHEVSLVIVINFSFRREWRTASFPVATSIECSALPWMSLIADRFYQT
jgi:hypothetical protein